MTVSVSRILFPLSIPTLSQTLALCIPLEPVHIFGSADHTTGQYSACDLKLLYRFRENPQTAFSHSHESITLIGSMTLVREAEGLGGETETTARALALLRVGRFSLVLGKQDRLGVTESPPRAIINPNTSTHFPDGLTQTPTCPALTHTVDAHTHVSTYEGTHTPTRFSCLSKRSCPPLWPPGTTV